MDLVIVGAGRAGGALALASRAVGHAIVGILSRQPAGFGPQLDWDRPLPGADLVLIAVSDSAIASVAGRLAPHWKPANPVAHLSGLTSVDALAPLADTGAKVGSFHPLQTLPDATHGAEALSGAWAAVTAADPDFARVLNEYARTLGMRPFGLADETKPAYHAAASAASNFVVEALAVSADLLAAAGVDPAVVEPLTRRVVENVFALGADAALTGPIARGDLPTVAAQLEAAASVSIGLGVQFRHLAEATARRVGLEL